MKKITSGLISLLLILSCANPAKELAKGNYDKAVRICKKKLSKINKKDKYILILEDAFNKAVKRDKERIDFIMAEKKDGFMVEIYNKYETLNNRQEMLKPILPLTIQSEGRQANITIENWNQKLLNAKEGAIVYLYDNSVELLKSKDKYDARKAYDQLLQVSKLKSNYKNTTVLIEDAKRVGTSYALIKVSTSKMNMTLPKELENKLKSLNIDKLNKQWLKYHTEQESHITYEYNIDVDFESFNVSHGKEQVRDYTDQKTINDGFEYVLDANGNVKKDSLGNDIKIPKTKNIVANIRERTYHREGDVLGKVYFKNSYNETIINSEAFSEKIIYNYTYAQLVSGTTEALSDASKSKIANPTFPGWPTDEALLMEVSDKLKLSIQAILSKSNVYIKD